MFRRIAAAVLLVVASMVALAWPAAAHGGNGRIDTLDVTQDGDVLRVSIFLVYQNDDEAAIRATGTVTAADPTGVVTEVPMTSNGAGGYFADIPATTPGTWALTVATAFPPSVARVAHDVATNVPPATTPPSTVPPGDRSAGSPVVVHEDGAPHDEEGVVDQFLGEGPPAAMFTVALVAIVVASVRASRARRAGASRSEPEPAA